MTTGVVDVGWRRRNGHRADKEGELLSVPLPLSYLWLVLAGLTVLEALNDLFGFAGPHWFYDNWIHNVILAICAVLVLARAAYEPIARPAWLAFGIALLLWSIGNVAWTVAYASQPHVPYPSFADVLFLAWYPLVGIGIFYLIRLRVPQFELHRWMDGIAVTLLVGLSIGFAVTFVIAIPLVWITFQIAAQLGRMERSRAAALLDLNLASPHAPRVAGSWWRRLRQLAGNPE